MTETKHILDFNGLYGLSLKSDGKTLTVDVAEDGQPNARFKKNIGKQLYVQSGGQFTPATAHGEPTPPYQFPLNGDSFTLWLGDGKVGEPIGTYHVGPGGSLQLDAASHRKLTVTETRHLGTFYGEYALPYPIRQLSPDLISTAHKAVTTDFHTHSSGQISGQGLIQVGIDAKLSYPAHLLVEAGIVKADDPRLRDLRKEKRVLFPPLEPQSLPDEVEVVPLSILGKSELAQLAQKMSIAADAQETFSEMEYNAYRYRYPIAKKPEILEASWMQVAKEYAAQGIQYAEIAYAGLDSPAAFEQIHRLVPKIEAETGVKLRFQVAIPRNWPIERVQNTLERSKILLQSPYIVGIDLIGYETNKSSDFEHAFSQFADWAEEHCPGMTMRVHAGENDKNVENVKEFLELMQNHPHLRARIGHGVYGMDEEALSIARNMAADKQTPSRLVFEFNPDSNVSLNNIDDIRQIPFKMAVDNHIPFVIGSDGSGLYQTTAPQLGMAAVYGGMDSKGFAQLASSQQNLQQAQEQVAKARTDALAAQGGMDGFIASAKGALDAYNKAPLFKEPPPMSQEEKDALNQKRQALHKQGKLLLDDEDKRLNIGDKHPIAIVGASGSSWQRISPQERENTKLAIDMLVHAVKPTETYIVQGRTKDSGLSKLVRLAVEDVNKRTDGVHLSTIGMVAGPDYTRQSTFDNLDSLIEIKQLMDVPDALVDHVVDRDGALVVAGGAAFTRNIITKADRKMKQEDNGGALTLLVGPEGAARDKAERLNPHYRAHDGKEILARIAQRLPKDIFTVDLDDPKALAKLEAESKARIAHYNVDAPEAAGQTIETGIQLGQDLGQGK